MKYCQDRGIGVIVRGPLAMGKLTEKFTAETTFPEGDKRETFLRDLDLVGRLSFLAGGRTMAQAALADRCADGHRVKVMRWPGCG